MNEIYMIIFVAIILTLSTVQAYGISTSTMNQEEINKLLNDEYQKTPFSGELNLYSILTILVVAAVIIIKFTITNTGLFGNRSKTETYKEYEKAESKLDYSEWSEERITDLKLEVREQKKLLEILRDEVNKIIIDIKNYKEISISMKEDVKDIKDDVKEQCNTLNDLEVKIAILEKLFDRNLGGGKE